MKNKKVFPLAKASIRIFARILDMLFLSIFSGIISFLLTFKITDWSDKPYDHKLFVGILLLSIFINFVIWFCYFIILPLKWKGYTLFKKALKIKIYSKDKLSLMSLMKHDFLIWIIYFILLTFFVFLLFGASNPTSLIINLFSMNYEKNIFDNVIMAITQSIFAISFLPNLIYSINMFFNSGKQSMADKISDTLVVHIVQKEEIKTTKKINKKKTHLPGDIDIKEL